MFALDTNLLIYAHNTGSIFHEKAAGFVKDNSSEGIYTVNTDDFKDFTFLKVVNPLQ